MGVPTAHDRLRLLRKKVYKGMQHGRALLLLRGIGYTCLRWMEIGSPK